MEMFLTVLALSIAGVLVSGVLFLVAAREREADAQPAFCASAVDEERFFMPRPAVAQPRAGGEVLVLQIERHLRLEAAVAEAFLQLPSVDALRVRTLSPLPR
jgi:hypothetical protein